MRCYLEGIYSYMEAVEVQVFPQVAAGEMPDANKPPLELSGLQRP